MKAYDWEYYSFRYYEASEQWQPEITNELNGKVYCNSLDELCEMLSHVDWKPILLSNDFVLFRRKKVNENHD